MEITQKGLGVEVRGVDLRKVDAHAGAELVRLVHRHKLIAFREQRFTKQEYVAFSRALGTPQVYPQDNYHHPEHPEIFVSSNVQENGKKVGVAGTGQYWHTDCQFLKEPLPLTMVFPHIIPSGPRGTQYIDMARVYRDLPPSLRRRVDGVYAVHEGKWRYKVQACDVDRALIDILEEKGKLAPPVRHPAVIRHPTTGERALYMSSGFTTGIEGCSYEEGKALLGELFAFSERDEYVHTHAWTDGDLLLWDNRVLNHKASGAPKGEKSVSYRIGVYDGAPFYEGIEA